MYIRRILIAVVLIGAIAGMAFAYFVYNAVFVPNTAFENEKAFIYIRSNDNFNAVMDQLEPLLKNKNTFLAVAKRKSYIGNVKSGKYAIVKGMNNNDIINSLRSKNIPVQLSFNNQETLERLAGRIADQIEADSLSLLEECKGTEVLQAK